MIQKDKIVGVLVAFAPTLAQVVSIRTISLELDYMFVVDNTEGGASFLLSDNLPENIFVLVNNNEGGIAGALNVGIKAAIKKLGDCFIFLLDQDSCLPALFFERQYSFAMENKKMVVAPKYIDINSKTFGNYTKLCKWRIENINGETMSLPFETTFAITSGTMIFSSLFEKIGLFREDYFIDHVDSEFCIRLHRSGHMILINPDVVFEHAIGKRKLKIFLRIKFKPNFHSPLRRYYAVRNGIFMVRHHFKCFPSILWLLILRMGYEYMGIILFENDKLMKLKALFLGLIDGILPKVGRCNRKSLI
ncbi:glycosyltransferase [Pelotalea chapellei]|uniref:Glycosyltransferase n=1 Tax=Pelotalea chapellei TaxID=44671 RepID=A0ABS5U5M7_9BACT|nr:glycosyltransferase [Pelotalea chapellei]MBT1070964.1 glycosyltransferase [Pelotalea chapellei]